MPADGVRAPDRQTGPAGGALGRVRASDWISGIVGAALLGSTFVHWYGVRAAHRAADAWQAFAAVDVLIAIAGAMAVGTVVVALAQRTLAIPTAWTSLTTIAAVVAAVLVAVRTLVLPSATSVAGTARSAPVSREAGVWIGLGLALALAAAAWRAMADWQIPKPLRVRPPVERLPAPAPDGTRRTAEQ